MAGKRLLGQDVVIIMVKDGAPVAELSTISSFSVKLEVEKKSEGFLGEKADRKDAIFKGISGDLEFQPDTAAAFDVYQAIADKARDRTATPRFNIKATLSFPDGTRRRAMFPDVEFGELPFGTSGRAEYAKMKLDFEGSSFRFL